MYTPLIETLNELKTAQAKIAKTETKKINLFESNDGYEIKFNNFKNPSDYLIHLQRMYFDCKTHFDKIICDTTDPRNCYKQLEYAKFEVKEFKNFYFSPNESVLIRRLEYEIKQDFPLESAEDLKKNS